MLAWVLLLWGILLAAVLLLRLSVALWGLLPVAAAAAAAVVIVVGHSEGVGRLRVDEEGRCQREDRGQMPMRREVQF